MNIRTTIVLIVLLAVVSAVSAVYISTRDKGVPKTIGAPPRDFFYQVDDDAIIRVSVTSSGKTEKFVNDKGTWRFDGGTNEPVFLDRWGGVTLLLSGPQFKRRVIQEAQAEDLQRYGLASPSVVITAGLIEIGDIEIRVGDRTADGTSHYSQYRRRPVSGAAVNDAGIYLVDASWGDVFSRLVREPPRIPTPTPEPSPTPGPGTPTAVPPQTPAAAASPAPSR